MSVLGAHRYRSLALCALALVLGACTLFAPSRDELSASGGASSGGESAAAGRAGDAAGRSGGVGASGGEGGVGASGGDAGTAGVGTGGTEGSNGNDGSAGSSGTATGGTAGTGGSNETGGTSGAGDGGGNGGAGGKNAGGSAGAGGSGPVPRLASLKLWMRSDAGVTLDGTAVTRWNNQAGTGPDAYQTMMDRRPSRANAWIGPPPLVTFDGVDDQLGLERFDATWSRGLTLFVVAYVQTVSPGRPEPAALLRFAEGLSLNDSASTALQRTQPVELRLDSGGIVSWEGVETSPQAYQLERVAIFSVLHQAVGAVTLFVNGQVMGAGLAALPPARTYDDNSLGKGQPPLQGGIGEILLYDVALDEEERAIVDQYLTQRWLPGVR